LLKDTAPSMSRLPGWVLVKAVTGPSVPAPDCPPVFVWATVITPPFCGWIT
jgi:hypothetical protein